jgi:uncharacterized protein
MAAATTAFEDRQNLAQRHPVAAYFALTFFVSWLGALAVASPHLLRREPLPQLTGILMFPAMLLGPSVVAVALARVVDGKAGPQDLFARMVRTRVPIAWFVPLLLPPVLVLGVLNALKILVSSVFAPNFFLLGIAFGVPAGLLEEIGWMGYAFPKMSARPSVLGASILVGLLWGSWHLPVINFLGTATPHGAYWFPFFLAFTAAMTAMRVLICWIYVNTRSVLLTQLMHISSTGSLVVFSAPRVTARQEMLWYLVYAAVLWMVVAIVVRIFGTNLTRP